MFWTAFRANPLSSVRALSGRSQFLVTVAVRRGERSMRSSCKARSGPTVSSVRRSDVVSQFAPCIDFISSPAVRGRRVSSQDLAPRMVRGKPGPGVTFPAPDNIKSEHEHSWAAANDPYLGQRDTFCNTHQRVHCDTWGIVRSNIVLPQRSEMTVPGRNI